MSKVVIKTNKGIFNVRMFQRSGCWYYDVHINGRRIRKSTGMTRKSYAIESIEFDLGSTEKLHQLLQKYLNWYKATVSDSWGDRNIYFKEDMILWFGQTHVREIKGTDIDMYINNLRERYAQGTVQKHGAFIGRFFRWCYDNDYIDKIPKHQPIGKPEPQSKHLTDEEIDKIFKAIDEKDKEHGHKLDYQYQRDVINFLLHTGLRGGELKELRPEDIHLDGGYFEIKSDWMRKTKTPRSAGLIPLNDVTREILERRLALGYEYVFTDREGNKLNEYRSWVRRLLKKAGVHKKGYGLHSFRHTFGYRLRRKGNQQTDIQKLMRHTQISTTDIYVHLDVETLRPIIESLVV